MVTLLIGHRGVGKSEFLKRLPGKKVDLDQEIEYRHGNLAELLKDEPAFRELERQTLQDILAKKPDFVAVGAGIEGPLPEGVHVIWLRRSTDAHGRSFLNRPRLNPQLSPYDEYMIRYQIREPRFRAWAHEELTLPEGYDGGLEGFLGDDLKVPFDITLKPENFRHWERFISRRLTWGIRRFEVRDDILSEAQMKTALQTIPEARVLYSLRRSDSLPMANLTYDWPLELGEAPRGMTILSLHQREVDFGATLERFSKLRAPILKLAIEVRSFQELERGHNWWLENPGGRTFLPRSVQGRWRWYRSLFGRRMPLHFIREGEGSSLDQPYLWQTQLQPNLDKEFAAVLGSPVEHSRSPMEHRQHFDRPFVAIDVDEEEFASAMPVLKRLGLSHAAVTAPLKKVAAKYMGATLDTINTISPKGSTNTDRLALKKIKAELPPFKSVWIWGAGGMKSSVLEAWPEAKVISAREGTELEEAPELIIWATGRSRKFKWPQVKPKFVLDLNYGDDSPGLEWAVKENLPYQSGLKMFKLQAELQRQFWEIQSAQ